ncbi:MAG: DNA/RNA nuclease SfsA [Gammaproteobacteria bacterium]|nr:DNA/RNA nuclease SfsA [Gammaproteobacteria bacterium]
MLLPPLSSGKILRRYKRFFADIELDTGEEVVVHCPNTGAMTSCWEPGAPAQVSHSDNPKRKLQWTLERVDMGYGWVGVNTARVNHVIAEGIRTHAIAISEPFDELQTEPRFESTNHPKSRFDILLNNSNEPRVYIEVKNTTLLIDENIMFPDAITERGRKHLLLLSEAVQRGFRGIIVFALNRPEGKYFQAASDIDPDYAECLEQVVEQGVEIKVVRLKHTIDSIEVVGAVSYP